MLRSTAYKNRTDVSRVLVRYTYHVHIYSTSELQRLPLGLRASFLLIDEGTRLCRRQRTQRGLERGGGRLYLALNAIDASKK